MRIRRTSIFVVGALSLTIIAGCKFGGGDTASGDASKNIGAAAQTATASADPKDVVAQALKNLQTAESWAAEVNSSNDVAPQTNAKMDVEYVAPDRFHIENNSGGSQFEVVIIGADSYLLANGKWQKAPAGMDLSQMINNWKQTFNAENMQALKDLEFAGEETANNKRLLIYTYRIDPLAAMPDEARAKLPESARTQIAGMNNAAKIWIDAEKKLPVKLEMTTKVIAPREITQKLNFDYKFDREVKIEAPTLAANAR